MKKYIALATLIALSTATGIANASVPESEPYMTLRDDLRSYCVSELDQWQNIKPLRNDSWHDHEDMRITEFDHTPDAGEFDLQPGGNHNFLYYRWIDAEPGVATLHSDYEVHNGHSGPGSVEIAYIKVVAKDC